MKGSKENDGAGKPTGVAQIKMNLNDSMTVPVGISYANRETDTIKTGFQLNVGFNALLDHLLTKEGARRR